MKRKTYTQRLCESLALFFVFSFGYMSFEPAIVTAGTSPQSLDVAVTQVVSAEISISKSADVTMSPSISGITGGTSDGSTTLTVITNNTNGFNLKVKASTNAALKSASSQFADYTEAGAIPDYNWSILNTDSEFGYTVEPSAPADAVQAFLDNGSNACNIAGTTQTADKCWANFTTSDFTVINRNSPTAPGGVAEVVKFKAQSGTTHFQQQGTYTATITVTATTNP